MAKEVHACIANAVDQRVVIVDRLERRQGAHAHDAVDRPGVGRAKRLLEPHDRAAGPGVHAAIEHDVVDAIGQKVALHRVPVLLVVDVVELGGRDVLHRPGGKPLPWR